MTGHKKSFRPSPGIVAIATAGILLLLPLAGRWVIARRSGIKAQVEIAAPEIQNGAARAAAQPNAWLFPEGEIERTALRVREVSALVIGLTLFAVNEGIGKRPVPTIESLLPRFTVQGLLPPDLQRMPLAGTLSSPWGALYLRYRPEPLAIEVISIGQGPMDGPALLGRLITGTEEAGSTTLFIARDRTHFTLPEAFASDAQLRAMNWNQEPLRERSFTPEERQQLEAWLQEQSTRERSARP